jgi:hypothetical protein
MYIGFATATTAIFGQKQTLMLHLFITTNNAIVVKIGAGIVHDSLIGCYLLP